MRRSPVARDRCGGETSIPRGWVGCRRTTTCRRTRTCQRDDVSTDMIQGVRSARPGPSDGVFTRATVCPVAVRPSPIAYCCRSIDRGRPLDPPHPSARLNNIYGAKIATAHRGAHKVVASCHDPATNCGLPSSPANEPSEKGRDVRLQLTSKDGRPAPQNRHSGHPACAPSMGRCRLVMPRTVPQPDRGDSGRPTSGVPSVRRTPATRHARFLSPSRQPYNETRKCCIPIHDTLHHTRRDSDGYRGSNPRSNGNVAPSRRLRKYDTRGPERALCD